MADEWGDESFAGMRVLDRYRNADGTLTVTEEHYFNRFKKDVLDTSRYTIHRQTGRSRKARRDDLCWTEVEYQDIGMMQERVGILQKTRIYSRNQTLMDYYNFVSGYDMGAPATAAGLGAPVAGWAGSGATAVAGSSAAYGSGLAPVMGATGAGLTAAGTTMGLAAFGYGVFYLGTWYEQCYGTPPERMEGESWKLVDILYDPPKKEWDGVPYWVQASAKKPCREETGIHFDPGHGGIGDGASRSMRSMRTSRSRTRPKRKT